jgi:hypothetical protein
VAFSMWYCQVWMPHNGIMMEKESWRQFQVNYLLSLLLFIFLLLFLCSLNSVSFFFFLLAWICVRACLICLHVRMSSLYTRRLVSVRACVHCICRCQHGAVIRAQTGRRARQGQTAGNCIAAEILKGNDMVLDSLHLIFSFRWDKT